MGENTRKVLITDYAWATVDVEREMLSRCGAELVIASSGEENELVELARDVHGILTCWLPVSARVITAAQQCWVIGRYGIGLDNIDVGTATQEGIIVTNVPAYCLDEVSDHAMALLLACARKISFYDRAVKNRTWNLQAGPPMRRIRGKTLGIIGLGKIGKALVPKAKGIGLKVIAYDPAVTEEEAAEHGVVLVPLEKLFEEADFISVHVPLTDSTRGLLGEEAFGKMKDTAFVINTSRGPVVDSEALYRALREERIAGAGLDVLPQEPPDMDDPLLQMENVVITPHASFSSEESLVELQRTAAQEVATVLSGKMPRYVVNPDVLKSPKLRAPVQTS